VFLLLAIAADCGCGYGDKALQEGKTSNPTQLRKQPETFAESERMREIFHHPIVG
jgi:hypothetical protein